MNLIRYSHSSTRRCLPLEQVMLGGTPAQKRPAPKVEPSSV